MHVVFDRPVGTEVWERATTVAGWIEGVDDPGRLAVRVGAAVLPVAPCFHPRAVGRGDLHGFWTEVVVQRHLDDVRAGGLRVELLRDDRPVAATTLRIMPAAAELARTHPLELASYPVPPPPAGPPVPPPAAGATPPTPAATLVFPGLGAVGGSSLQQLMRRQSLQSGAPTTVYGEADDPALWTRSRPDRRGYRWIDGHACHGAVDALSDGAVDALGDSTVAALGGRAVRVTLLRDPIQRLASVYSYGTLVHPELFPAGGFDAFVASGAARTHSQAAGLWRLAHSGAAAPRSDTELLAAARDELARAYALVGVTERFEETIFLLCRLAGWTTIGMWWRVLAAPLRVEVEGLARETRRRLARDLAPDLALYEEAQSAFATTVAAAAFGPALPRYRDAAARQRELSPAAKTAECLRWRRTIDAMAAS